MAATTKISSDKSDRLPVTDWPAYWLVCLERGLAEGNLVAAATAQKELRRLGWDVVIKPISRNAA